MDEKNNEIFLNELKTGKSAVIRSVDTKDKSLRRHILDMGLTPGTKIKLIKTAPLGDPLEIYTRGYELTIRKADAAKIKIAPAAEKVSCKAPTKLLFDSEHPKIGEEEKLPAVPLKNNLKLALAGNQNSGKTTLFNQLTGAHQHVGNFPGVTIERTDGIIRSHPEASITDLPGIYSLSPYSKEEIITRNFILTEKPDAIINIVDASNIERNLFLTLQLIELNIPMVIALNMMDEVRKSGGAIDINGLERILGVPVVPISAAEGEGVHELIEHAINIAKYQQKPNKLDFCDAEDAKTGCVHRCIHSIAHLIEDHAQAANLPLKFAATKLLENDTLINDMLALSVAEKNTCKKIISDMENERGLDKEAALADMRFSFIERLCYAFVAKPFENPAHKRSLQADKILTGKYTAVPVFIAIMALIFYLTFGPVGSYFSDMLERFISFITEISNNALSEYGLNPVVRSLIIDGCFAGIGSVLSFLPIIVILFFFLSILEDCGYMARIAFVMDRLLRGIGLSGCSFVPMLIGFGCSVPAIMATRTLPSERDRKMTILLIPFMSCSAKLPIYALFTAAFFTQNKVWVILSLYLLGIIVGLLFAAIIKLFIFKGEAVPFVMELPNYRLPAVKNVLRLIYAKAKGFITKAFTIIFFASVIIWFCQSFDSRLNLINNSSDSLLASFGNFLVPLFHPLGMDDWRISTAFITGFMAKESVISTLTVLLGGDANKLPLLFTPLTAFVFLTFSLLYTPCVAAVATVKRELGNTYAVSVILVQCLIAWSVAFIVFRIGLIL